MYYGRYYPMRPPESDNEVTVKARIFDDGSIKIDINEDVKTKLLPLRGKDITITFMEIEAV